MTDLRKAAEIALEALSFFGNNVTNPAEEFITSKAIVALRQALAQPEQVAMKQGWDVDTLLDKQEPVREHNKIDLRCECCGYMTYHREHLGCIRAAAPPSKPWVSLTDEEINQAANNAGFGHINIAREIEAKLKELNHV